MWTVVAFLNPQSFIWIANDSFPWAMAVAAPTLAGLVVFSRGWMQRLATREVAMIVILWLWFTVTTVVSTSTPIFIHHAPDTWYRWQFVSKVLLMTVVTIAIVDTFARLRILLMVMAGCFGCFVLKAIPFLIATAGTQRVYGPEHSMVADNNDLGLALNMTLPLFFFLAQSEEKRWVKRLFGTLFLLTIPVIFATYSRGALVGLLVVMVLMFLQLKQRWRLLPVIALGVLIVVLFAPATWKHRMDPTRSDAVDASARNRLNAWHFAFNLACDYPITGGGFDTFSNELFQRYAPDPTDPHGPHSIYFEILGEHGFVGLILYLLLVGSAFLSTHHLVRQARQAGDRLVINYANMIRFSIVGFLSSGLFLGRAYFDYYLALIACLAILKRVCAVEWPALASEELVPEEQAA
jgi:probable O-glycosylation ligase (exosortase A-associated)